MKKYFICLIIVFGVFLNSTLLVKANTDAEILFGVWFSRSKVFTEKVVRIYVSLVNKGDSDVMGTIELYNNGVFVNRREVIIVNGKSNDWWFDQRDQAFVYGEHIIKVKLVKSFIREIGKSSKEVVFKNNIFTKTIFIDRDLDDDDIGDLEDPDDDNDGISDKEEIALGLDPGVKNSEPEIKVARERLRKKNEKSSIENNSKPSDNLLSNLSEKPLDKIISSLPKYIADPVKKSDKIVSNISNQLAQNLTEKRKKVLFEIKNQNKESSKTTLNPEDDKIESSFLSDGGLASLHGIDILKKTYAAILFGLIYILETKIILYPILLFIIYKLIRLLFKRINRKPLN